ncbi:hypothetical protein ACFXAZ_38480 [Streptomyces sp. NPDC059477]|uniref:hypothetical protein n=1 Tax=Streptomyces sp. NPDC059477 TaxID=3346847 RepID=UPI0036A7F920
MTTTIPTPRDIAASRTAPPAATPMPGYDRQRWEQALIATALPHPNARLLGWGLAHLAGPTGHMAPDVPDTGRLAAQLGMSPRIVRQSLTQLEHAGLVSRPDIHTWQPKDIVRPLTLTIPQAGPRTRPARLASGG